MKTIITAHKPKMTPVLDGATLDELSYSDQYAEYIMEYNKGDRVICNGDTLLDAMEDGYLWDDFLISIGYNNA